MAVDVVFQIIVDDKMVSDVVIALEQALSATSLADFMAGKVHDWWKDTEVERFADQGDLGGGGTLGGMWAELAPATVRIRETLGYQGDAPINVRDGEMFNVLITQYDLQSELGGATMTIPGSGLDPITEEKIKTAQMGKVGNAIPGMGDTPPRPVLNLTDANAEQVLTLLNQHLFEQIQGGLL